jgi:hypothetical protein
MRELDDRTVGWVVGGALLGVVAWALAAVGLVAVARWVLEHLH